MNTNPRFPPTATPAASRTGIRRGVQRVTVGATIIVALAGCAAIKQLKELAVENPPIPPAVETTLQPGPTPPSKVPASRVATTAAPVTPAAVKPVV
ncbi:MAG: hypothetical protein ABL931_22150, partial [Usitatibacteraceae bacterium]